MRGIFWGAALASGILATTPALASPNPNGFWLSLTGQYRTSTFDKNWVALVIVNVPLDRFAQQRAAQDETRALSAEPRLSEEPPKKESPTPPAPNPPAQKKVPVELLLTPALARGAVRHALRVAGYFGTRERLANLSGRARSSAVLPELRFRTLRSTGENLRLTPTLDNPYDYTQGGTSELLFEARLTWHLDRLVFAEQEVSIERLQTERDLAERKLIEHVLERLTTWQRCRVRAADEDIEPDVRETAELEAIGAAVELDVLTDGWFSEVTADSEPPARVAPPAPAPPTVPPAPQPSAKNEKTNAPPRK
ncbi:MAG TPA: hypothetical protein VHV51_01775 [Polyangiaceae bacterium]|jgi:hypothetical protein|nr:hypothetical protein [Polyangiaceae bacterium]